MFSRREILTAAGRGVPALAGGALAHLTGLAEAALAPTGVGQPLPAGVAQPSPTGVAQSSSFAGDWASTATRARYWTSVGLAGRDCGACHHPAPTPARAHAHPAGLVKCLLCAHGCTLRPGEPGRCRTRVNVRGELRSLTYGRPVVVHVDPIEKKPFYHFLPGSSAYSFGSSGCPLRCRFCQNWELSQSSPGDLPADFTPPLEVVRAAGERRAPVIAFTYNEPTTFTEYLLDIAQAARVRGLRSVLVSCGIMREAPLADMCRSLDAIKIDLKGFSEDFYRLVCGAELKPVLRSIAHVAKSGTHLEIVNLVVPTLNDGDKTLKGLCAWVAGELGPDVPIHFTRFHPDYQLLNLPPTPVATLERARELAMTAGLRYAYVGNVPGHAGNHTYCPGCGKAVIRRENFFVSEVNLARGRCRFCQRPIAGVWT
jgi:pyruvate formate lyase activating enzyme